MMIKHDVNNKIKWIETEKLSDIEQKKLNIQYNIHPNILQYVMDIHEQSHYLKNFYGFDVLIIHMPFKIDGTNRYISRPVSFVFTKENLFTFNESGYSIKEWSVIEKTNISDGIELTLLIIKHILEVFNISLHEITKQRLLLDEILIKNVRNQDLIELYYLQQSITFLESSISSNIDTLTAFNCNKELYLNHAVISQAFKDIEMQCKQIQHIIVLESKIVSKTSQIFDSIMNNNLNDTMKFLTIWSLAIAIPTLITGFYGMNITLPSIDEKYGWVHLLMISIVLIVLFIIGLKHKRKM